MDKESVVDATKNVAEVLLGWPVALGMVISVLLVIGLIIYLESQRPEGKKVVLRTNVLILLLAAYGVVSLLFFFLVSEKGGLPANEAWNILEAPLMTLIGGTLAISKDLIQDDDEKPTTP